MASVDCWKTARLEMDKSKFTTSRRVVQVVMPEENCEQQGLQNLSRFLAPTAHFTPQN